jgi:hypothetical protein
MEDIRCGFPQGDDASDSVAGLIGVPRVCLGQRGPGGPDGRATRVIEGWILDRECWPVAEGFRLDPSWSPLPASQTLDVGGPVACKRLNRASGGLDLSVQQIP